MKLEDFLRSLPMEVAFLVRSVLEGPTTGGMAVRLNVEDVKFKFRGWTISLNGLTAESGNPPAETPFVPPTKGGGS